MYLLEKTLKFPEERFESMITQPFELKEYYTMRRIQQWLDHYGQDGAYISFSGGIDSTVLSYLACKSYERNGVTAPVHLVFSDTGIEFPEIRVHVKNYFAWLVEKFPNVKIDLEILKPQKGYLFKDVCEKYGFPIISKENALKIRRLRNGKLSARYRNYLLNGDERGNFGMLSKKWQFLTNKDEVKFCVSEQCCDVMKKRPFKMYHKRTNRFPIIGITQDEGHMRKNKYMHEGCNVYDGNRPKCQPLAFWKHEEVLRYAYENKIPVASVYGKIVKNGNTFATTGEQRTGCVVCGFGCHLEKSPNRLQRLEKSHHEMWAQAMRCKNNGVTYQEALETCGIETVESQLSFELKECGK